MMATTKQARGYSTLFISAIETAGLDPLVKQFADECVRRGIPIAAIASRLDVTRASVYNWFTGRSSPRQRQLAQIKKIVARWTRARPTSSR